jgi:tetratricopeptide (TPR) repeat protein
MKKIQSVIVLFKILIFLTTCFDLGANAQINPDSLKHKISQSPGDPKLYNDLCEALIDSTLAEAGSYAEKALQLAKTQGLIIEEARALYHLGDISFRNQDFKSAADYHIQSANLYQQTDDYMGAALSFNEAGFICHKLDRFDEALEYYKKSMQYLIKLNNTDDLPYLLINIGQIFEKKADYDSALFYYEKAKTLADKPGMEYPMNVIYGNMGIVYTQSGNLQKALENYELALEISKTNNFENAIGADLSNIANVYLEWQNHQMAIKYFSEAIEINRKTNNKAGLSNT